MALPRFCIINPHDLQSTSITVFLAGQYLVFPFDFALEHRPLSLLPF